MRRLLPVLLVSAAVLSGCSSGGSSAERSPAATSSTSTSTSTTEAQPSAGSDAARTAWDAATSSLSDTPYTIDLYSTRDSERSDPTTAPHSFHVEVTPPGCTGSGWSDTGADEQTPFTFGEDDAEAVAALPYISATVPHTPCDLLEQTAAVVGGFTAAPNEGGGQTISAKVDPEKLAGVWADSSQPDNGEFAVDFASKKIRTIDLVLDESGAPVQLEFRTDAGENSDLTVVAAFGAPPAEVDTEAQA